MPSEQTVYVTSNAQSSRAKKENEVFSCSNIVVAKHFRPKRLLQSEYRQTFQASGHQLVSETI